MMIWAKKKKSPHFREKYLVLSYLNSMEDTIRTSITKYMYFTFSFSLYYMYYEISRAPCKEALTLPYPGQALLELRWGGGGGGTQSAP